MVSQKPPDVFPPAHVFASFVLNSLSQRYYKEGKNLSGLWGQFFSCFLRFFPDRSNVDPFDRIICRLIIVEDRKREHAFSCVLSFYASL